MSQLLAALVIVAMGSWSTVARAQSRQPGAVYDFDKRGEKPSQGPAPKRDLWYLGACTGGLERQSKKRRYGHGVMPAG